MAQSTRFAAKRKKTHKYLYAITCWSCKQQFAIGYAWLKRKAQIEDLQNEVEAKGRVGGSENCHNLVNGHECGAANQVTRDALEFADDSLSAVERLGDSLSWR